MKDGEEVLPSPRAKATYKDGMATLDLKDLEPEDGGKYTCRATNSFGDIETTANLKVEGQYASRVNNGGEDEWCV